MFVFIYDAYQATWIDVKYFKLVYFNQICLTNIHPNAFVVVVIEVYRRNDNDSSQGNDVMEMYNV